MPRKKTTQFAGVPSPWAHVEGQVPTTHASSQSCSLSFQLTHKQPKSLLSTKQAGKCNSSKALCFASVSLVHSAQPTASMSSKASSGGQAQSQQGSSQQPSQLELLPVGTHRGHGSLKRYVWDGQHVKVLDASTLGQLGSAEGRVNQWFMGLRDSLFQAFLPDVKDVTPDYWEWIKWRLSQRFFSSTTQNLSTQSLLLALGMGAKKTIAASAAINWLLKDGVGRIARMTVATNFGQSFDSDLKRIRFTTSIIFEATIGCEFITPFFPQHFLPLASLANVGKAIALAAFVAVAPAFQQALCAGANLADLTAKNQAQHMVVDTISLAVSAGAMYAAKNMKVPALLPLMAYPILGACDLYCIYRELKSVQLRTLNKERAQMVAAAWARTKVVPTAAQISRTERLLLPPSEGQFLLPLHILPLSQLLDGDPTRLTESAKGSDIMTAILEAVYLRHAVADKITSKQAAAAAAAGAAGSPAPSSSAPAAAVSAQSAASKQGSTGAPNGHLGVMRQSDWGLTPSEIQGLRAQARKQARKDATHFVKDVKAAGWKVEPFLLSTTEREGYVMLDKAGKPAK